MARMERETKLELSPADYETIRRKGRVVECRDQLNIYFHDPALVKRVGGHLRVRYESGREPVATLKIPAPRKGTAREMLEVEKPLREMGPDLNPRPRRWLPVGDDLPGEFRQRLETLGLARLRRLGWMRNERCVVELETEQGPERVELDRTRLPDGSLHHEVEIENPSREVHGLLVRAIRAMAPSAEISLVGKFTRFLQTTALPS